jgi:hypothetical protein
VTVTLLVRKQCINNPVMLSQTQRSLFFPIAMNSTGSVSIAGVVVLESPRAVDPQKGSRHIVFDANFCITQGSETVTTALLRYFASTEMAGEIQKMADKPFQKAFIVATVRLPPNECHHKDNQLTDSHQIASPLPNSIPPDLMTTGYQH